jgi:hypothetical protein
VLMHPRLFFSSHISVIPERYALAITLSFTLFKACAKENSAHFCQSLRWLVRRREGATLAGYLGWDGRYPSPRCLLLISIF